MLAVGLSTLKQALKTTVAVADTDMADSEVDQRSKLKGQVSRWAVKLLGQLPLPVGRFLGGRLGWLSYFLNSEGTCITRINLRRCYPDLPASACEALVKQSMIETGRLGTELPAVWVKSGDWVVERVQRVQNQELLDKYLGQESGLVLLVPHLGNWEVFGPWLPRLTPLTALYQPPRIAAMDSLIRESRERHGAKLVPTDRRGVMALFKSLKAGGTTLILPDQVPDKGAGEHAPFCGVPALTMTLVHSLIERTGCRVLMAYAKRVAGGFELVFQEPDQGIYSADQQTSLVAMNRSVADCVADCPSQYQWEYKRFKKQPASMEKIYPKKLK